ncbi:hypothetical protein T11_16445 [Trichinella zimbabwensis]|uniref:Uncharacterized protein n=1 Tax=Trichinella zimbabwensis TaxID=268475 RepID=A0A0V1HKX4_9BILA|nr:hypothetical protein T11_16445 [Trichinella zimbabwensis]
MAGLVQVNEVAARHCGRCSSGGGPTDNGQGRSRQLISTAVFHRVRTANIYLYLNDQQAISFASNNCFEDAIFDNANQRPPIGQFAVHIMVKFISTFQCSTCACHTQLWRQNIKESVLWSIFFESDKL